MKKITLAAFARKVGVSRSAVTYAVSNGRLKVHTDENGSRFLDEDEAEVDWFKNADEQKMRISGSLRPAEERPGGKRIGKNDDPAELPTITESRAQKEKWLAKTAQLNYEERVGQLVDAEEVRQAAFKVARAVRNGLNGIPDRIAAELAAETNQFRVHKILSDEIRRVLEGFKELSVTGEDA